MCVVGAEEQKQHSRSNASWKFDHQHLDVFTPQSQRASSHFLILGYCTCSVWSSWIILSLLSALPLLDSLFISLFKFFLQSIKASIFPFQICVCLCVTRVKKVGALTRGSSSHTCEWHLCASYSLCQDLIEKQSCMTIYECSYFSLLQCSWLL